MKKEDLRNIVILPFVTNLLAVILGIVITFAVQDKIDDKHEMEGIRSGLSLVEKELTSNIQDLHYALRDLRTISQSAKYLYDHIDDFRSCPADSINRHWTILNFESYLTLPDDALEMLKSTYLYSDMLDRELSLSVVRAYDICDALERSFKDIGERRINSIEKIDDFFMTRADEGKGNADLQTRISSYQGKSLLFETADQSGPGLEIAIQDIEAIVADIHEYLNR